jgi:hypothetical protein
MDQHGTASSPSSPRQAEKDNAAQARPTHQPISLAGDILYGADAIAEFIHGSKKFRRTIYNLVETKRIPHFRIGAIICARKSVLLAWITGQEQAAQGAADAPKPVLL